MVDAHVSGACGVIHEGSSPFFDILFMLFEMLYNSPFGAISIISDGNYLLSLNFVNQNNYHCNIKDDIKFNPNLKIFSLVNNYLDNYFSSKIPLELPPIKLMGTDFQMCVWRILLTIPYGKVSTYGRIAKKISSKMSSQAVGSAIAKNPVLIIVPCHRVINSNCTLGGYAAGLERKKALLELELSYPLTESVIAF